MIRNAVGIVLVLMLSCGSEEGKKESNADTNVATCACETLTVKQKKAYLKERAFTGICYSNYPETDIRYESRQYKQGIIQNIKYYSKDGSILTNSDYLDGKKVENPSRCDCSDLKRSKGFGFGIFKNNGQLFTGICRSYYPGTKNVYREERYEVGLKHGYQSILDKNGNFLHVGNYAHGYKTGIQMKYDSFGNLIEYDEYNSNGELVHRQRG